VASKTLFVSLKVLKRKINIFLGGIALGIKLSTTSSERELKGFILINGAPTEFEIQTLINRAIIWTLCCSYISKRGLA
jgi:hypothetical protein